jgi:hypothetical protein
MKRKFISMLTLIVLTSGLLVTQSCKKQECPVDEPTKKEILLKEGWKGVKVEEYNNGNLVNTQSYSGVEWFFLSNGKMIIYYSGNPGSGDFTYTIQGDVESITLQDNTDIYYFTVKEIKENSLILEITDSNVYLFYFTR